MNDIFGCAQQDVVTHMQHIKITDIMRVLPYTLSLTLLCL